MVGPSNGNTADVAVDSSSRSDVRKARTDVNRMPGSAASMKVAERAQPASKPSRRAIQAMQPFLDSSTASSSPIQPTDVQLLTTSILSNQERQRVILYYQEQLIEGEPTLHDLKKSLLFLSSSSWGQILEERKLAGKCSYPTCSRPSPSSGKGGKFRINLRAKSVTAVEDLDLGEAGNTYDDLRDFFCSQACYARSEWILRWVLSEKELGFRDGDNEGGGGVLGGKWQKLVEPGGFERVELLEDIERAEGVDFDDGLQIDSITPEAQELKPTVHPKPANVSNLLGDLTIIERTTSQAPSISRLPYTVDLPNNLGSRFHPSDDEPPDAIDATERELAHILRYASLAPRSRAPRRTRTAADVELNTAPQPTRDNSGVKQDDDDVPTVDPSEAAERAEVRRMMDAALDVRRELREQGLLD